MTIVIMFYTKYMGLLPTTRFSAASGSEPCGSACSDIYLHNCRLPPSSRFFYFCRAQSALHGDQCLQHGDQLRHVRAPCNFLRLVIFKLTLLIITRQKTTKSTASQRVCDPTASTRPSLACDVSPAKVTVTMGEAEAASAAADVRRWSPCRNVFLASLALPVYSLSLWGLPLSFQG